MQLLTVGRSLSEARDRPHRFKLLNGTMPTFGHPNSTEGRQKGDWNAEETGMETTERKTESGEQAMKSETSQAIEKTEKGSSINAYPLGRWTLKANPFKSSTRPARQPGVQGELVLEKVKVVRNDLTDSDLELVAAGNPVQREEKENVFAVPGSVETTRLSLWARVKDRLFRAKAQ